MKHLAGSRGCWGVGGGAGQATSVPKARSLSPSPELLPGAPLTSKVLDTDPLRLWRGPSVSGISLPPSAILPAVGGGGWGLCKPFSSPSLGFPTCAACMTVSTLPASWEDNHAGPKADAVRCKRQVPTCSLSCLDRHLPVTGSRGCLDGVLQMRVWRPGRETRVEGGPRGWGSREGSPRGEGGGGSPQSRAGLILNRNENSTSLLCHTNDKR